MAMHAIDKMIIVVTKIVATVSRRNFTSKIFLSRVASDENEFDETFYDANNN